MQAAGGDRRGRGPAEPASAAGGADDAGGDSPVLWWCFHVVSCRMVDGNLCVKRNLFLVSETYYISFDTAAWWCFHVVSCRMVDGNLSQKRPNFSVKRDLILVSKETSFRSRA